MKRLLMLLLMIKLVNHSVAQSLTVADSFFYSGDFKTAIVQYDRVLQYLDKHARLDIGNAYLRKGFSLAELMKKQQAIKQYFLALSVFEQLKNDERICAAQINIANIYDEQDDLLSAEKYFSSALDISYNIHDSVRIVNLLNDLAVIKYKKGATQQAIQLHSLAFTNYANVLKDEILCNHLLNLGNCYENARRDSSLFYYLKAEAIAEELEDTILLARISLNIGDALKQKRQYIEALAYLNKSLRLNEGYRDSTNLSIIYESLAATYDSLKQYDKAYYYARKEHQLNDGLYNIAKSRFATELSEKYESEKKDEKITSQEIESRLKSRNLLLSFIGIALLATLAIISFVNYRRKQKANKVLQLQNQRIEKLNLELDTSNQVKSKLFSVISHDIRGPISSIYAYLQMQQPGESSDRDDAFSRQTEQLLDTLEDLLVWSKSQLHQFVPVTEVVRPSQVVDQLTGLFQSLIDERQLHLINAIPPFLALQTDLNMITIILRNILSNAIKYATVASNIEVASVQAKKGISIIVSNSTAHSSNPIPAETKDYAINSNTSGLGMTLIKEFTEKLGGNITTTFKEGVVSTSIYLPT